MRMAKIYTGRNWGVHRFWLIIFGIRVFVCLVDWYSRNVKCFCRLFIYLFLWDHCHGHFFLAINLLITMVTIRFISCSLVAVVGWIWDSVFFVTEFRLYNSWHSRLPGGHWFEDNRGALSILDFSDMICAYDARQSNGDVSPFVQKDGMERWAFISIMHFWALL
jgi:hypothetical protein